MAYGRMCHLFKWLMGSSSSNATIFLNVAVRIRNIYFHVSNVASYTALHVSIMDLLVQMLAQSTNGDVTVRAFVMVIFSQISLSVII